MRQRRIIVMGFMASCPIAGVIWQHLHYIVGLQRLGYEVFYVEDSARYPYNPITFDTSKDCTFAVATLRDLGRSFGFEDRWAYCARFLDPPQSFGLDLKRLRQLYREAGAILNVCGAQELHEDLLKCEQLIYVESDPGVEQIKVDQGDDGARTYLGHHRTLFTFGENIGSNSFPVPLHGLKWLSTRQPVVIDFWRTDDTPTREAIFTTIANWSTRGRKDVTWNGATYFWSKTENFLKFIDAPKIAGETFELAADIRDDSTARQFCDSGWRLKDPQALSIDRDAYRRYITASRGEFTIAKDQYVRLNTAWFSDRSACYLAAGRPVITQETGFTQLYGGKRGLLSFSDLDEVREAAAAIRVDYVAHSRAAFEIAAEFFDAKKVLTSLLDRAGI
jgi:hypothetical protein